MKKFLAVCISLIMVFGIASISFADEEPILISAKEDLLILSNQIRVQNNGEFIDFTDSEGNVVEPQIINDRTMVPFRKIFNALGVKDEDILWNGETRTVVAKKDNLEIELQIDNTTAKKTIDGEISEIKLDSAPVIVDGRTLVPVRFIAESMDKKVGWDNTYRTVIIIDTEELKADLEKAIPKFIEMTKSQVEVPEKFGMTANITGSLEYKDKTNKENNSTTNLVGTIDVQKGTDILKMDLDAKFSGKGSIYELIKESGFTNFDFKIIVDENKMYMKSSMLDSQTNGKWLVMENSSLKNMFTTMDDSRKGIDTLFEIKEEDMNIYTYESIKMSALLLKTICKDENITITEKGTTKTYEYNIDVKDILDVYNELGMEMSTEAISGKIKSASTYKNNVEDSSNAEIKIEYKEGDELITFELKLDGKVSTKNVTINTPSDSQVVSADELN